MNVNNTAAAVPVMARYGSGTVNKNYDWTVGRVGCLAIITCNGTEYLNDAGQSWPGGSPGSMLRTPLGVMPFVGLVNTMLGRVRNGPLEREDMESNPEIPPLISAYRAAVSECGHWVSRWPRGLSAEDRAFLVRRAENMRAAAESAATIHKAEMLTSAVGMLHPEDFLEWARRYDLGSTKWGARAIERTRDFLKAMEAGR